jgi:SPP1 family predicted phage head-tail adaptor
MEAGRLNRRITILHRTIVRYDPPYNTPVYEWTELASVWAEVQDMLPSRAERIADGINIARRPARVRMRFRTDIDSTMRISVDGREMRIVAGPVELGRREGLELMAEELSTEGQEP